MKINLFKYKRFVFDNYIKNISENLRESAAKFLQNILVSEKSVAKKKG